jgi:hypothetical protein
MKIGAENKKSVYALAVLGVFAAYMVYSNFFSGPSYAPSTPAPVRPSADTSEPPPAATPEKGAGPDISRAGSHSKTAEFHPALRPKKKEDRIANIENVDPTIRFDLLDTAMHVPPAGGDRDLFQISKTPPVTQTAAVLKGPEPNVYRFVGPHPPGPPPGPPPPPPTPPPTPVPFRYFGYSAVHPDGKRTAYFLDGEEILAADEGAVLKGRWRIVQIGLDKVLVEDTREKRRQPVNIEPELTG